MDERREADYLRKETEEAEISQRKRRMTPRERNAFIDEYNAGFLTPEERDALIDEYNAEVLTPTERDLFIQEHNAQVDHEICGGLNERSLPFRERNRIERPYNSEQDSFDIARDAYRFVLARHPSNRPRKSAIDTTLRCMERFIKEPNYSRKAGGIQNDGVESSIGQNPEPMTRHLTIIKRISEKEVKPLLELDGRQDLSEVIQSMSEKLIVAVMPEMLDRYVDLLLDDSVPVTGEESLSMCVQISTKHGAVIESKSDISNWHSHVFDTVRLRALSLVAEKGRLRLTNQEYSSARGYGSPSVPLDMYMLMMLGLQENAGIQVEDLISTVFPSRVEKPGHVLRRLRALRTKSLETTIQLAQQEGKRMTHSPAFVTRNGRMSTVTSLMKTGFWCDNNDTLYHIGTGRTQPKSEIVFRNADYERKLQLRTEIGVQAESAYLTSDPNVVALYVFSVDGASNPVVIGGTGTGFVVLPRGKAWGHSTTISTVSDLSGITTTVGTQSTRNDWISTVKVAIGRYDCSKWNWQMGRVKGTVMEELTRHFMTPADAYSMMQNPEANHALGNPMKGLLLRIIGGSQLYESGKVGVLTKRNINPRSIDCLFLADILAGNNPELAALQRDGLRQQRIGVIENDRAMSLLFDMDETVTSLDSRTMPMILEDPLLYIFGVLGGRLLHSLQGTILDEKPLVRYHTKGFSRLNRGTECEKMRERLRLSQQEALVQETDLAGFSLGPSPLEQVCLLLSTLKIANEIQKHIDMSDSLHEVAIRAASTLVSHKIGDGIRADHTKLRSTILAKTSAKYDTYKSILIDSVPPDWFGLDRNIRNVHALPILGGPARDLKVVEDLFMNGQVARFMIDNGETLGSIFLPCDIEKHTSFQKIGNNLSVSSTWSSRGSMNLLFILKPKEELRRFITSPVKWNQIEKSLEAIDYISRMMFNKMEKSYSQGEPKLNVNWTQERTKYGIPEGLDYDGALLQCAVHYDNVLTHLESELLISDHTFWDIIDPNKLTSFVLELLLCSKSAVVTDPMGKQGRLHLDSNGMTRGTSDVLAEVATEKFLPMMETLSLGWLQKKAVAGIEGHSEGFFVDIRPGPGQDGTMLLHSPDREIPETWVALESKTYNILSSAKGQNPAKARDNIIKGLLNHIGNKIILTRLSFGKDCAIVMLPALSTDYSNSNSIRDEVIAKTLSTLDSLIGRLGGVAESSGHYDIAKDLDAQRNNLALLLDKAIEVISPKDVEMGVLLSLVYNELHLASARSHFQRMSPETIQNTFSEKTIMFFKMVGWIDQ